MTIKCIPIKEVYFDSVSGFRIMACEPLENNTGIKMNKYGNFTVSGSNINFKLKVPILLELQEKEGSKYEGEYSCVGYGGIEIVDEAIKIPQEQEQAILCQFMTKRQANNVLEAYPNFVEMILNGQANEIDTDKIYNVDDYRFADYIEKIEKNCDMIFFNKDCWELGITKDADIEKIRNHYKKSSIFISAFNSNPYEAMCDVLNFSFDKSDPIILNNFPELKATRERCKYFCIDMLKAVEAQGDTKINPSIISRYLKANIPELYPFVVDVIKNDEKFYYDNVTKFCSLKSTRLQEENIAEHILGRVERSKNDTGYDKEFVEQFRTIGDMSLTDEQMRILEIMEKGHISVLTGAAGCVDCDTEFFTGTGWKRIADYEQGDKVLQYNEDGTAELVEPVQYIKKPCDTLWHFENKHGINQTVCEEHRILYITGYEPTKIKETNILSLKQISDNDKHWTGKFINHYKLKRKGMKFNDSQIRLMIAVMAEGRYVNKTDNKVKIRLKKQRKIERLEYLLKENKLDYKMNIDKYGVYNYVFYPPERRKIYGGDWWNANPLQLKIIEEEVVNWDGGVIESRVNKKKKPCFRTTEKQSADYIQYVFNNNGWQSTITKSKPKNPKHKIVYKVTTSHTEYSSICFDTRPEKTKTEFIQVPTTDGFKYCFTVPSNMLVLRRKDCIFITGNCGKTASLKALVRMFEAKNKTYTILTPTGISAKVVKQATGRPSCTVHMALARQDPIGEYVVLEESSMITVKLLSALFDYIGKSRKIVFVCDENQLPSIGAGNVVHDIIASGVVPIARLTKIFRYNSSGIITNVTDVRNGKFDHAKGNYSDFNYIEATSDIKTQLLSQYQHYLDMGYKKDDILILTPFRVTDSGSHAINNIIQSEYNHKPETEAEIKVDGFSICFKVGDRVINTKNNYHMPKWDIDNNCYEIYEDEYGNEYYTEMPVYNGDLGNIVDIRTDEEGKARIIVEWDNGFGCVEGPKIQNLLLGYCISIHKSQGAQSKCIIIVINKKGRDEFINRNLLYVAFSRAQEQLSIIANKEIIKEGLEYQANLERETWLEELLNLNELVQKMGRCCAK